MTTTSSKSRIIIQYLLLLVFVIGSSYLVSTTWIAKKEEIPKTQNLTIQSGMTITEFGEANKLNDHIVGKAFNLESKDEFSQKVSDFGFTNERLSNNMII